MCECKNKKKHLAHKKIYIWNPATCSGENGNYAGSINGNSVITCDEIIEGTKTAPTKGTSTKTVPTKTVLRKSTSTNFCILLAFLLISIIDSC